jgi:hypothetical protein
MLTCFGIGMTRSPYLGGDYEPEAGRVVDHSGCHLFEGVGPLWTYLRRHYGKSRFGVVLSAPA